MSTQTEITDLDRVTAGLRWLDTIRHHLAAMQITAITVNPYSVALQVDTHEQAHELAALIGHGLTLRGRPIPGQVHYQAPDVVQAEGFTLNLDVGSFVRGES